MSFPFPNSLQPEKVVVIPRTAEVIFVGDAASIIAASQEAADAVSAATDKIAGSNDAMAGSYGEALAAAQESAAAAAESAALVGGSLEDQAAAAKAASDAIMASYGGIDDAALSAAESAKAYTAAIGGSLEEQTAAYQEAADSAIAAADEQRAAMASTAEAAAAAAEEESGAFDSMSADVMAMVPGWQTVAAVIVGVGVESVKMAARFEEDMTRVQTEAGASAREVAYFKNEILALAGHTEQTPKDMAEAAYWLASAGLKGRELVAALKESNELADVSGAKDVETAKTVSTIIDDLKLKVSQYQSIAGEINATVGAGKMTLEEYNDAMGKGLLSAAAGAGVGLGEVNAALATVTRMGIPAARAATGLRQAFQKLGALKETNAKGELTAAGEALHEFGLTSADVSLELQKPDGFLHLVDELSEKLSHMQGVAKSTGLRDVLELAGGVKSGTIMQGLVEHPEDLERANQEILKNTEAFHSKLVAQEHTLEGEVKRVWSGIEGTMIKAGGVVEKVIPHSLEVSFGLTASLFDLFTGKTGDFAKDTEQIFGKWGLDIEGTVTGLGGHLLTDGEQAFEKLATGIGTQTSPILQAVSKIGSGIVRELEEVIPGALKVGEHIVDGLVHGVEHDAGNVAKAAEGIAKKVEGTLNEVLEIKSPSKMTQRHGEAIGEGLVAGMKNATAKVASASADLGKAALEALWVKEGGPKSEEQLAAAVALAESAGSETASNPSGAEGLWQIKGAPTGAPSGSIYNPEVNARDAVLKYEQAGNNFSPWQTYETGAYKQFLGASSASSTSETKGEREARKAREEHERKVAKDVEAGQKELSAILGAIHSGKLTELTSVLKGAHERGLKQLEQSLVADQQTHLDRELVAAHKAGVQAMDVAIVKEWNRVCAELTKTVNSAVEKAVATWTKTQEKLTKDKYSAAMSAVETGPEAELRAESEGGEATEAKATERSNARALTEAQKALKEAKESGNKEAIEKAKEALTVAEESITNFARQQDEKRKQRKIESEKQAISQVQSAEEQSLEARTKEYEAGMLARTHSLETMLQRSRINVEAFMKDIDAITGVTITVSAANQQILSSPPSSVPVVVGGGPQPGSHASGGELAAYSPSWVGETGPEMFTPSVPGTITPAAQAAGGVTNHFHGPVHMGSKRDADRFAHKLAHKLRYGGR